MALALFVGAAGALDVKVQPYRMAAQTGNVGVVAGRTYVESRTPNGATRPLTGTTVTLLPRSQGLLLELERLKEQSRQSSKAFTAAAPAMQKVQESFERELTVAGVPDLAPRILVGTNGDFRLTDVPAGSWVIVAWHSMPFDVSAQQAPAKDRGTFQLGKRLVGYDAVTIWLREISLARDETVSVDLTDRNHWFQGVIEERVPP